MGVAHFAAENVLAVVCELERAFAIRLKPGLVEELHEPSDETPPRWLSYGRPPSELSLHTDYPDWPSPPRFIVMRCISVGRLPVETIAVDMSPIGMTKQQAKIFMEEPWVIRNSGKPRPIRLLDIDRRTGRSCFRYAENVMRPRFPSHSHGVAALSQVIARQVAWAHVLWPGEYIIIDNWRMLHARRAAAARPLVWHPGKGRVLQRTVLMTEHAYDPTYN
ncbi:TauD/TfdA family dioxygenase [Sphingomonas crusticola]|uniref:TauD/TfdA family dioxygenase n=1 Tax=Sphingomonas crusticola TaxID=1697973 RepID=UPI0013C32AD5|nr:TauD/TfdA family dioxygenase [Sphingomonas crusticola]